MAKTSKQIEGDIYHLLSASLLSEYITGGVYRHGLRPRDSRREDATVMFTTGTAGEIEEGVVTIHIYVPDLLPYSNGVRVEDGSRVEQVERLAQEWSDSLRSVKSGYTFRLHQTITTDEDEAVGQHFVVVKLRYRHYGSSLSSVDIPSQALIDVTPPAEDAGPVNVLSTEDGRHVMVRSCDKQNH